MDADQDTYTALDRAQQLVYKAWETRIVKRRVALANEALSISPLCADAFTLLAQTANVGSDEALARWRDALEAARTALGEDFDGYAGEFWGFLETRPYMRARLGLAMTLWHRGARAEAVEHLVAMLALNPNDNQGVRHLLATRLLELGRDAELAKLLRQYRADDGAVWVWSAALAAFRKSGDGVKSRAALTKAAANNPHVAALLLGDRAIPKRLPAYMSPGEADEAVHYAADARGAWQGCEGALDWLRANSGS